MLGLSSIMRTVTCTRLSNGREFCTSQLQLNSIYVLHGVVLFHDVKLVIMALLSSASIVVSCVEFCGTTFVVTALNWGHATTNFNFHISNV